MPISILRKGQLSVLLSC